MRSTRTYRSPPRRREPPATRLEELLGGLVGQPVATAVTCLAAALLVAAVIVDAWGRNAVLSDPVPGIVVSGEAADAADL